MSKENQSSMTDKSIDKTIFFATISTIVVIALLLTQFSKKGTEILNVLFNFATDDLGVVFLGFGVLALIFLVWLMFSKYGNVKFGTGKPEYSTFSWIGMMFTAGLGSTIFLWSTTEWGYHVLKPPFGIEPLSQAAQEWSLSYGMFHWGITAWAFYCLPSLAIAYAVHNRKKSALNLSIVCEGILGKYADGLFGKIINILFTFGLFGGIGTSLGLNIPMVAKGVAEIFGVEPSMTLNIGMLIFVTLIFTISSYIGLEKGLKNLSASSTYIALSLAAFVIVVGPTKFILNNSFNSVGLMFQNYMQMSTCTDPIGKSGFPQGWTIFYWAWWIALSPFMGIFVTKISKGRTIKQLILAMTLAGSAGCWFFYGIFGSYAMNLEIAGKLKVTEILNAGGTADGVYAIFETLPLSSLVIIVFTVLCMLALSVHIDSSAYTLAAATTKNLSENEHPARWHRLFWAIALSLLPLSLMQTGTGTLQNLQTLSTITAIPIVVIVILMIASMMKWLQQDYK